MDFTRPVARAELSYRIFGLTIVPGAREVMLCKGVNKPVHKGDRKALRVRVPHAWARRVNSSEVGLHKGLI